MDIKPFLDQLDAARVPGESPRDIISEFAEAQALAATAELFRVYDTNDGVLIDWREDSISEPQNPANQGSNGEMSSYRRRHSTELLKAWVIQFAGSVAVYAGMDYFIDDENAWPHIAESPVTLTTLGVVASAMVFAKRKRIGRNGLPPGRIPRLPVADARSGSVEMAEKMQRSEQMDEALFIADEEYAKTLAPEALPESFGLGDDRLTSETVLEWLHKHEDHIPGLRAIKLIVPEYNEETGRCYEKLVWKIEINPASIVRFLTKGEDNPAVQEGQRALEYLSCLQDIQIAQSGLSESGNERVRTGQNVVPMDTELRTIQKQELARIDSEIRGLKQRLSLRTLDLITASLVQRTKIMGQAVRGRIDDIELRLEPDFAQVETFPLAEYIEGVERIRERLASEPILTIEGLAKMQELLDSLERVLFPE